LAALVSDRSLREKMGAAGKILAENYFSLEKSLIDHAHLYEFSQKR
jgi:hypothetical protein